MSTLAGICRRHPGATNSAELGTTTTSRNTVVKILDYTIAHVDPASTLQ